MSFEKLHTQIAEFEKKAKTFKPDPKKPPKDPKSEEKKVKRALDDLDDLDEEIKDILAAKEKLTKAAAGADKMKPEDLKKLKDAAQDWRDKNTKAITDAVRLSKAMTDLADTKDRDYFKMANYLANSGGATLDFDLPD